MTPDEDFTPEMKARAQQLGSDFRLLTEDMWYDHVVDPLAREYGINQEAAEVLAADWGV